MWLAMRPSLVRHERAQVASVPVLIEAGLVIDGAVAISQLLNSGVIQTILAGEPSCKAEDKF
jgi:hypothetical protein